MTRKINLPRAIRSLLLASLVPGAVAFTLNIDGSTRLSEVAVGTAIFFVFSAPLVFCVGLPSLLISLRFRYGPVLVPPVVGLVSGLLAARLMYAQGLNGFELFQFTLMGLSTAAVAAVAYFRPSKPVPPLSMTGPRA